VRCTAPALMPHSAADETPRRGGTGRGRWSSGEDGAVPNSSCAARGRRSVVREEDDAADRWGRSASEGKRASERGWQVGLACQREGARGARRREGLAGGVGVSARGSEGSTRATSRTSGPANGPRGRTAQARGRGGGRDMGRNWPSRGGNSFPFSFYLLNSFPICFFFFLHKII
jgi:hypothetical protein